MSATMPRSVRSRARRRSDSAECDPRIEHGRQGSSTLPLACSPQRDAEALNDASPLPCASTLRGVTEPPAAVEASAEGPDTREAGGELAAAAPPKAPDLPDRTLVADPPSEGREPPD